MVKGEAFRGICSTGRTKSTNCWSLFRVFFSLPSPAARRGKGFGHERALSGQGREDGHRPRRADVSPGTGTGLLPCLFLPQGAGVQACVEVQLWSCPMAQPVKEEVCSWLSLQVFLPKVAGTQVNEDIAPVVQPQYTSRSTASTFSIPYNRVRNAASRVESNYLLPTVLELENPE